MVGGASWSSSTVTRRPDGEVVADFPQRAPREPHAGERPVVQHRAVVARERPGHALDDGRTVDDEAPAALRGRALAEGQAAMLREVGGSHRRAVLLQVPGLRDDDAPAFADLHSHQLAVGLLAEPDRAVESFRDEVGDAVGQFERDRELGMLGDEARHERGDVRATEARRRGDAQVSRRLLAARRDGALGVLEFAQDPLAVLQEGDAFRRQRQAARGALDQLDAQPGLERIEPATDHRRRQALVPGRGAQAAALRDVHERGDFLERVHRRRWGGFVRPGKRCCAVDC